DPAGHVGVALRIGAPQLLQSSAGEAQLGGVDHVGPGVREGSTLPLRHRRGGGGGEFVHAVVAVDDHGPHHTVGGRDRKHLLRHGRVAHAHHLPGGSGGVGQGQEEVEHGG